MLADGRSLLDTLPLLLLEATVNGLSNRRLHQVDVAHHQWYEEVLQVFVERPVAQVSCRRQVSKPVKLLLTSARRSANINPHEGDLQQQRFLDLEQKEESFRFVEFHNKSCAYRL